MTANAGEFSYTPLIRILTQSCEIMDIEEYISKYEVHGIVEAERCSNCMWVMQPSITLHCGELQPIFATSSLPENPLR